jgi:hypothetical protein
VFRTYTYHSRFIPECGSRGISDIASRPLVYQNYLAVRNTVDVTSSKPIAVRSQSISGVSARMYIKLCIYLQQIKTTLYIRLYILPALLSLGVGDAV